jgi:DnaJ-class molecular chaperone
LKLTERIKEVWRSLDYVPDCPVCKGTGEPSGPWTEKVWWKGKLVEVCHNCKGRGKV